MEERRKRKAPAPVAKAGAGAYMSRRKMELITPVFGGGVLHDPNERQLKPIDPVTPIRTSAVRGQLREWWRRGCGLDASGRPLALETLRAREAVLWGWASTEAQPAKGWVGIAIHAGDLTPRPIDVFRKNHRDRWEPNDADLGYALFPLSPDNADGSRRAGQLTELRGTFEVVLEGGLPPDTGPWGPGVTADALWEEVELAFELWATFGGVGARTRRGFGSVAPADGGATAGALLERLGWRFARGRPAKSSVDAHKRALGALRTFRQGKNVGRNPGEGPRPGRSRWPEPDQIRGIKRQHARMHPPVHPVVAFPRAAFGLPIIFHFKDRDDPPDTTLTPKGQERMASPLLLRVVKEGTRFVPYAIVLPQRQPLDEILAKLSLDGQPVRGDLMPAEQADIRPLAEARTSPSRGADAVFEPFLSFFQES